MDKPLQEKCGIVGVFSTKYSHQTRLALLAAGGVQHRGAQGAGLVTRTEKKLVKHTGDGLLKEIFTPKIVDQFNKPALWTIVHCRYGTHGGYHKNNLQPCLVQSPNGDKVAVAHNGEFVAIDDLKKKIGGRLPPGASDTYLFSQFLSRLKGKNWDEKITTALSQVKGAYSLIVGIDDTLYLARDNLGIRPLIIGRVKDKWVATSETHALDKIGAKVIRQLKRGELVKISKSGLKVIKQGAGGMGNFCDFEWAYFSRPDSLIPTYETTGVERQPQNWLSVARFRERCGAILAREKLIKKASFVVGAPDSGIALAMGYANEADLPYRQVIIRDHFDPNGNQRLFMRDDQIKRIKRKILGKLSLVPDREIWKDAVVVIGDDSIVRGNVTSKITKAIFSLGAKEVHWIIGFPPVAHRCFLGVSIRTGEELLANKLAGNIKRITRKIGATSVNYISHRGFIQARFMYTKVKTPKNPQEIFLNNGGCGGCITGIYPVSREGKYFYDK